MYLTYTELHPALCGLPPKKLAMKLKRSQHNSVDLVCRYPDTTLHGAINACVVSDGQWTRCMRLMMRHGAMFFLWTDLTRSIVRSSARDRLELRT